MTLCVLWQKANELLEAPAPFSSKEVQLVALEALGPHAAEGSPLEAWCHELLEALSVQTDHALRGLDSWPLNGAAINWVVHQTCAAAARPGEHLGELRLCRAGSCWVNPPPSQPRRAQEEVLPSLPSSTRVLKTPATGISISMEGEGLELLPLNAVGMSSRLCPCTWVSLALQTAMSLPSLSRTCAMSGSPGSWVVISISHLMNSWARTWCR